LKDLQKTTETPLNRVFTPDLIQDKMASTDNENDELISNKDEESNNLNEKNIVSQDAETNVNSNTLDDSIKILQNKYIEEMNNVDTENTIDNNDNVCENNYLITSKIDTNVSHERITTEIVYELEASLRKK
jgi:hypothetical protein